MMMHSAEIRWFFPQSLPNEVLHWFKSGRDLDSEGVREDDYLLFPDCDTVGVKLREGKFEVKALLSPPRPFSLIDVGVNGRIDQWVKWSFDSAGLRALDAELRQSGYWRRIRKERFLRKFSADTGALIEIPAKQQPFPASGCNVELVRIEVGANPGLWFSLGFEAFGSPAGIVKTLDDTLYHFFKAHGRVPQVQLTGRESFSYPTWLATFA